VPQSSSVIASDPALAGERGNLVFLLSFTIADEQARKPVLGCSQRFVLRALGVGSLKSIWDLEFDYWDLFLF
jgi:hypothetical protein